MIEFFSKIKNLAFVGSGNIISTGISGIFWFYIASLVGTDGYGQVSYLIAIASIVHTITLLGIGNTIVVYTSKENKIQVPLYFVGLVSGTVGSIILYFVLQNEAISLYVWGAMIFTIVTSEILGRKLFKNYLKIMISQRLLMVFLAITLYHVMGLDGIVLGYGLSYLPFMFIIIRAFTKNELSFTNVKFKMNFSMHNFALNLSRRLSLSLDKLIIFPIFGFALLGNYQLGIQVFVLLGLLSTTVFQFMLPNDATGNKNNKLKFITVLISGILSVIAILLAPIAIPIFFPDFDESVEIIQILSIAIFPFAISQMMNSKFLGNEKSKIVFTGAIIFIFTQIIGIVFLGELYGIVGTAIAFVIACSFQSIFLLLSNKILLKSISNK